MRIGPRSSEVGLADILSRHVNFFQRKNSLRGRKIFSRRHVGRTMQILPTIVEKTYQLARAWKQKLIVSTVYWRAPLLSLYANCHRPCFPRELFRPFNKLNSTVFYVNEDRITAADFSSDELLRKRVEDRGLNRALQGPRSVLGVVSFLADKFLEIRGE